MKCFLLYSPWFKKGIFLKTPFSKHCSKHRQVPHGALAPIHSRQYICKLKVTLKFLNFTTNFWPPQSKIPSNAYGLPSEFALYTMLFIIVLAYKPQSVLSFCLATLATVILKCKSLTWDNGQWLFVYTNQLQRIADFYFIFCAADCRYNYPVMQSSKHDMHNLNVLLLGK